MGLRVKPPQVTDKDTLLAMLARASKDVDPDGPDLIVYGGYTGFYTVFSFDKGGALTDVAAYE